MEETNTNYQNLKKNIKDFIKSQNTDKKKKWWFVMFNFVLYLVWLYLLI
jgi:hypothetical protein